MPSDGASPQTISLHESTRLRLERDLYLGLLGLNETTALDPFLRAALDLMLRVAGASQGYIEIFSDREGDRWWTAAGCSDEELDAIRAAVSRGIIAEAVASGTA